MHLELSVYGTTVYGIMAMFIEAITAFATSDKAGLAVFGTGGEIDEAGGGADGAILVGCHRIGKINKDSELIAGFVREMGDFGMNYPAAKDGWVSDPISSPL
jgi:regulator of RNase E activity RraB